MLGHGGQEGAVGPVRGVGCPLSWGIHSFLSFFLELGFGRLLPILVLRVSAFTLGRRILFSKSLIHFKSLPECSHHQRLSHSSQYFLPWAVHTVAWSPRYLLCPGNHYRSKSIIVLILMQWWLLHPTAERSISQSGAIA